MIIDTHCHLFEEDYDNRDDVIKKMENNIMIVSGASPENNKEVLEIISQYDNVYGTIGIHPEFANSYKEEDLTFVEKNLNNPKIVGIGEIGLDYKYNKNKTEQKCLFQKQIELAIKYNKAIVVHSRDAMQDTYDILEKNKPCKCIMHCFSGNIDMAKRFVKMGVKLGIGGVLTFKNEKKLKEVVSGLDLINFVLETDSPYLSPEPLRGTKNEPYNVMIVALKIAELKNIAVDEVLKITSRTAINQFDLDINV